MNDEQRFSEALRVHAETAGASSLTIDDVRGRARGIRRRRAAAGAAGAAALVAAAVVPLALLTGGDSSRDALPPAESPTVSDTANPVPEPTGPELLAGWYVEGALRTSDGTDLRPDVDGEVVSIHRLGEDRWVLGAYPDEGSFQVVVVDATGAVTASYPALEGGLATDDAGTAVGWLDESGVAQVLTAETDEPVTLPAELGTDPASPTPMQVLPGCTLAACALLVEVYPDGGGPAEMVRVDQDGRVRSYGAIGLISVTDVSPDGTLVTGLSKEVEPAVQYCSAVVEISTGRMRWETCDQSSLRFSPDGTLLLGIDSALDGLGHSFVDVLDAEDGSIVRHYEGGTVFDESWESAESYLVSMQANTGENLLLRFTLEGGEPEVVERAGRTPGDPSQLRLGG